MSILLDSQKDWEAINQKMGVDVISIVLNLDNRYTIMKQAELIVERCNLVAKAQGKKIALKLQAIYNLPDEGMFHKKMGEFIEELNEEVSDI